MSFAPAPAPIGGSQVRHHQTVQRMSDACYGQQAGLPFRHKGLTVREVACRPGKLTGFPQAGSRTERHHDIRAETANSPQRIQNERDENKSETARSQAR
jgi:hypothetical protein